MRLLQAALAAGVVVCLVAAADAAPRKKAGVQAAPQSLEALYQYCRIATFRKFGWHSGDGRLMLYTDFLVSQTDHCVRNRGQF